MESNREERSSLSIDDFAGAFVNAIKKTLGGPENSSGGSSSSSVSQGNSASAARGRNLRRRK